MLTTLGAAERRAVRGRRGTVVREASPEPVPTSRVTVIAPEPFSGAAEAEEWLERLRSRGEPRGDVEAAVSMVNRALHADRTARGDPDAHDIGVDQALVVRLGFGDGRTVAEGRYERAWELPRGRGRRARRSMEASAERFAALLAGRERPLACEELLLRARADVAAGRTREAALQARVALESILAELGGAVGDDRRGALEADRKPVREAADAALRGPPGKDLDEAVKRSVERMEALLRARRLGSAS